MSHEMTKLPPSSDLADRVNKQLAAAREAHVARQRAVTLRPDYLSDDDFAARAMRNLAGIPELARPTIAATPRQDEDDPVMRELEMLGDPEPAPAETFTDDARLSADDLRELEAADDRAKIYAEQESIISVSLPTDNDREKIKTLINDAAKKYDRHGPIYQANRESWLKSGAAEQYREARGMTTPAEKREDYAATIMREQGRKVRSWKNRRIMTPEELREHKRLLRRAKKQRAKQRKKLVEPESE